MKNYLKRALVVCGLLALAVPAWSYTILNPTLGGPDINVGGVDTFLDGATLANSSDATELQWVKDTLVTLGLATTEQVASLTLSPNKNVFNFVPTIESGFIASPLQYAPEYFYLKLGSGNLPAGADDHLLFQNLADLNYAVIDINDPDFTIVNIGGISHVGQVGGGVSVPEAGALLLFGSGLIGLVGFRRVRRMQ